MTKEKATMLGGLLLELMKEKELHHYTTIEQIGELIYLERNKDEEKEQNN